MTAIKSSLSEDQLISIVGEIKTFQFSKVKDAVIELSDKKFYWKTDTERLVKLTKPDGKSGLFRKESKLVIKLPGGKYELRKNLVTTNDGIQMSVKEGVQLVNGDWVKPEFAVKVDGKYYSIADSDIVSCRLTKCFIHKSQALPLSTVYYPNARFKYVDKVMADQTVTEALHGTRICRADSIVTMNIDGEEIWYWRNHVYVTGNGSRNVFRRFKDQTNPQFDRIDYYSVPTEMVQSSCVPLDSYGAGLAGCYIHKAKLKEFDQIYKEVILVQRANAAKEIKKTLKYDDDGPDENQAATIQKIAQPWPGKHKVFTPDSSKAIISKASDLLGGFDYTFGIELETSQGLGTSKVLNDNNFACVGDRSIGAGEYVSPILGGNSGLKAVEEVCADLAKTTFVDNRCGLHVHIKNPNSPFDRHFCQMAIRLGVQIEPDLYASQPNNRAPQMKHCHSIARYREINDENWREMLGSFVFGPLEKWSEPFDMKGYKYGSPGMNKDHTLDPWCPGRYKWMNLVHILSASKIGTWECRIFAGTTNFNKVYMAVLTCMAFVWFVENKPSRILEGGLSLFDVLSEAFIAKRRPDLAEKLCTYYHERMNKFNRNVKTMYPATIPPAFY